jgi:hypothetical protein
VRLRVEEKTRCEVLRPFDIDHVGFTVGRFGLSGVRVGDRKRGLSAADDPEQEPREILARSSERQLTSGGIVRAIGDHAHARLAGRDIGERPLAFEALGPRHRHHPGPDVDLDVFVGVLDVDLEIAGHLSATGSPAGTARPGSGHLDEDRAASAPAWRRLRLPAVRPADRKRFQRRKLLLAAQRLARLRHHGRCFRI